MIFTNQIPLFLTYKNRSDFYKPNLIFLFFIYLTKANLIFLLKDDIIHKANLFKLIFVKCLLCVLQHIIQHHTKGYIMVIRV